MGQSRLERIIEQLELHLARRLTPEERRLLALSESLYDGIRDEERRAPSDKAS